MLDWRFQFTLLNQSAYFHLGNSPSDDAKTCENRLLLVPALRAHQARPIIWLFFCPTQLLQRWLRSQVKADVYLVDQKNLPGFSSVSSDTQCSGWWIVLNLLMSLQENWLAVFSFTSSLIGCQMLHWCREHVCYCLCTERLVVLQLAAEWCRYYGSELSPFPPKWPSHEQGVSDSSVELSMTFNLLTVRRPLAERELVHF